MYSISISGQVARAIKITYIQLHKKSKMLKTDISRFISTGQMTSIKGYFDQEVEIA